jgi:hypothetical protein
MEINYKVPGEKGKQCRDCKHFKADKNRKTGKCMGYPVESEGGCNLFEIKNPKA